MRALDDTRTQMRGANKDVQIWNGAQHHNYAQHTQPQVQRQDMVGGSPFGSQPKKYKLTRVGTMPVRISAQAQI